MFLRTDERTDRRTDGHTDGRTIDSTVQATGSRESYGNLSLEHIFSYR
jgi:hypothetical protein